MKSPRIRILTSFPFFSNIFSATKRSIEACQKLHSIWFRKILPNPRSLSHPPHKLGNLFSVPSLSSVRYSNRFDVFGPSPIQEKVSASKEMEAPVRAVEKIVGYQFMNKRLLEEALTHSSYTKSNSYQRLEFTGHAALGLALSNYVFFTYPSLDSGQLSLLRVANISTEKLARVAIKHGLYQYVRHNAALDDKVAEFTHAIQDEDDRVTYGGSVKAPKFLADIVESVAAAIYIDCNFDLQALWVIFKGLLEPIATPEDLQQQPQPVTMLFELCQKEGKQVKIKHRRKGLTNFASVYIDGKLIASSSTEQKETAKLNAAKDALQKLSQ